MPYLLPQTTVIQNFRLALGAVAAPHSAVMVGPAFALHRYTDVDEKSAINVGAFDSTVLLTKAYPGVALTSLVDLEYTKVFMEDAILKVGENPSIVDGTFVISGASLIITALSGSFFQGPTLPAELNGRSVIPGDQLKLIDNASPASVTYVTVRTSALGVVTVTTPIDAAWIAGLTVGRFDIEVLVLDNVEITERRIGLPATANWTGIAASISIFATGITAIPSAIYNGVLPLEVYSAARTYIHYRARRGDLGSSPKATSLDDVAGDFGPISTDNPLAYGIFKALQNSGTTQVYGIAPIDDQDENWIASLGRLDALADAYIIVPLTNEVAKQDLVKAHIDVNSAGHTWRIGMFGQSVPDYTEKVVLPALTGGEVTLNVSTIEIVVPGSNFIANGVVVGDFVKTVYAPGGGQDDVVTYRAVTAVISNDEIHTQSGIVTDYTTGVTVTVVKQNLTADHVDNVIANAGHFKSRRIYSVWPDTATASDGEIVAGYYVAAAVAGLRSTSLPHQGLTNITLNGFIDMKRTTDLFTGSQLNAMAAAGVWIVTKALTTGEIYTRHQLSTDPTDLNSSEQSITTNVDDISFKIYDATYSLVGVGNVTPTMFRIINDTVLFVLSGLTGNVVNDKLGPQLITGSILTIAVDPVFADKINVGVVLDVPEALNQLEITLTV